MTDKHLNLFYTYNRDEERIENNLTRAFIVFLSVISGPSRQAILSNLLAKAHRPLNKTMGVGDLDFTVAQFALQSRIDSHIPQSAERKILLTVSSEPLGKSVSISGTDAPITGEMNNGGNSSSVPDGWIYDKSQVLCVLVEAKVGSNPLHIGQLQAHALHWFGSTLEDLIAADSLSSVTWIDLLQTLKDLRETLNERSYAEFCEEQLISHLMEFVNYYGYHLFDGLHLDRLDAQPAFHLGHDLSRESAASILNFSHLQLCPNFQINS